MLCDMIYDDCTSVHYAAIPTFMDNETTVRLADPISHTRPFLWPTLDKLLVISCPTQKRRLSLP